MAVTLGEALEMARSAGMIGDDLRCQALVNAGEDEAADVGDRVEIAVPAEAIEGAGARRAPASWAGGRKSPPKLVVIDGRAAATAKGRPAPAARLSIVTIDGERVHAASLRAGGQSRSTDSGVRR